MCVPCSYVTEYLLRGRVGNVKGNVWERCGNTRKRKQSTITTPSSEDSPCGETHLGAGGGRSELTC